MGKNQIIIRLENLSDRFDKSSSQVSINVDQLSKDLYHEINGKLPRSLSISEVSIQGTMLERERHNFKWKGVDDGSGLKFNESPKDDGAIKVLEP